MSLRCVENIGAARGYVPLAISGNLGQTQTISNQEIVTELTARGYRMPVSPAISPPISPPTYTTQPTMTRTQAIKLAVDKTLDLYRKARRCTRLGGCPLTTYQYNDIVKRAAALATSYLRQAAVTQQTTTISPYPYTRLRGAVSPRLSGIGETLYNLGQGTGNTFIPIATQPPTQPPVETPGEVPMTRTDWIVLALNIAGGGLSALQTYYQGKAARERAGVTATLTAEQVKDVVSAAMQANPALNRSQLEAATAGLGGREEPKGTPSWVVPVVIGTAAVALMSSGFMGRGRGRR